MKFLTVRNLHFFQRCFCCINDKCICIILFQCMACKIPAGKWYVVERILLKGNLGIPYRRILRILCPVWPVFQLRICIINYICISIFHSFRIDHSISVFCSDLPVRFRRTEIAVCYLNGGHSACIVIMLVHDGIIIIGYFYLRICGVNRNNIWLINRFSFFLFILTGNIMHLVVWPVFIGNSNLIIAICQQLNSKRFFIIFLIYSPFRNFTVICYLLCLCNCTIPDFCAIFPKRKNDIFCLKVCFCHIYGSSNCTIIDKSGIFIHLIFRYICTFLWLFCIFRHFCNQTTASLRCIGNDSLRIAIICHNGPVIPVFRHTICLIYCFKRHISPELRRNTEHITYGTVFIIHFFNFIRDQIHLCPVFSLAGGADHIWLVLII